VLEIRPNVAINKGIAVAALIPARPIRAALYAGDDRTDVDAFTALRTLRTTEPCLPRSASRSHPTSHHPKSPARPTWPSRGRGFVAVLEALAAV
jgi:trehalose-6-phosphatase